ncbi:MAG TPA: hypothetical protein VFE46_05100 [Pirellulales bacterium]|jgi:hypothetical protein|nr:hypothetical protein [Pirellulales bacterium]
MIKTRLVFAALLLIVLRPAWAQKGIAPNGAAQSTAAPPKHLTVAQGLVAHLDLANTSYKHGEPEASFVVPYQSHADCSGFIDLLLQYSYGYTKDQFKPWFGSARPSAKRYHDAIADQKGFVSIAHVQDMLAGDLLGVKYLNRTDNTGHVMLAAERPINIQPKAPLVAGTQQWTVTVIDSSESGHGPTDTRHGKGPGGKDHDGVGSGVLRLYTDAQGQIVGFSWSTLTSSEFKKPTDENLMIGRLQPGFQPN